ncbi:MAG: hypothetical protein QOI74_736 [Micromonosporaceae bacterium]|jgi:uncharacterized protein YndB with AHSA1/START domain|nr:hypothetical protein [Micromonosporaceae bacterium]MDT5039014.1 hypothetical protein [Micromonosporaceae bacterium]
MGKIEITAEPGSSHIVITREYDAPRDLVFRPHTDLDLLVRWRGPREGVPGRVCLEALTLEESEGRTHVRTVTSFQSPADRDAMIASGMEHGVRDSYKRLSELLVELLGAEQAGARR